MGTDRTPTAAADQLVPDDRISKHVRRDLSKFDPKLQQGVAELLKRKPGQPTGNDHEDIYD
jgi:hypothetical protein